MRVLAFLALLAALALPAHASQRLYVHAELETLAAPIAHYPEPLLTNVLIASTYPTQVMEAARYGGGQAAFHPSVRALLEHPDVLEQMARSPAWLFDLGNAWLAQGPQLRYALRTVQQAPSAYAPPSYAPPASPALSSAAPAVVYVPQPVYVPVPVYVAPTVVRTFPPPKVITHHPHRSHGARAERERFPNGRPSVAAQLQAKDAEQFRERAAQTALPPGARDETTRQPHRGHPHQARRHVR